MTAEEQVTAIRNARELMSNSWNQLQEESKNVDGWMALFTEMDGAIAAIIANDNTDGMIMPSCPKCPDV